MNIKNWSYRFAAGTYDTYDDDSTDWKDSKHRKCELKYKKFLSQNKLENIGGKIFALFGKWANILQTIFGVFNENVNSAEALGSFDTHYNSVTDKPRVSASRQLLDYLEHDLN